VALAAGRAAERDRRWREERARQRDGGNSTHWAGDGEERDETTPPEDPDELEDDPDAADILDEDSDRYDAQLAGVALIADVLDGLAKDQRERRDDILAWDWARTCAAWARLLEKSSRARLKERRKKAQGGEQARAAEHEAAAAQLARALDDE